MTDLSVDRLEQLMREHGCSELRWIDPGQIVVARWVRMKCRFGCPEYGHNACCPPSTPPVQECEQFFREYTRAAVLHFATRVEQPEQRHAWTRAVNLRLLELERQVFLAGYRKAFLLFLDSCCICQECAGQREACKTPTKARPAPEAMAVDVFATVRQLGLPIEVLTDHGQQMNRYAFLMVE